MIEDIHAEIDIGAPVARVWQVLTSEGLVEQWLGCLRFRCELGHVFYMQPDAAKRAVDDIEGAIHCRVERLDPPHGFSFTWYYPDQPTTLVALTLTETDAGTRAALVHSGWDKFDDEAIRAVRDGLSGGWTSFVLPALKRVAET